MYRFLLHPRWLAFHLIVVLLVVVMINLGFWQLRRLDQREAYNASVRERSAQPVAEVGELVSQASRQTPAAVEWRPVRAVGTYLTDEEVLIVNRSQGGIPGSHVVTPLALDDGSLLLVNRGFVPEAADVARPQSGTIELVGRARDSDVRRTGQLTEASDGELTEFLRIDIDRIAQQLPSPVLPIYVELTSEVPSEVPSAVTSAVTPSGPAQGVQPVPVPEQNLSEGPHLSYAIQWFIFSACAVVGWLLAVRRSALTAAGHRTAKGFPAPAADEPATAPR